LLKELRAKNYKSLKDLRLEFGKFNVLIGPNASGKSNIMDCLAFLSGLAKDHAVSSLLIERGGFDHVAFGGEAEEIRLGIRAKINGGDFSYEITITEATWHELLKKPSGIVSAEHDHNTLSTRLREVPELANFISSWAFYSFLTSSMRTRLPVKRSLRLEPDGSNLAQVLMTLVHEEPKVYRRVEEALRQAIPEVEELLTPLTEDGKTYIAVREKGFTKPFDYHQLSDGTLKLLAYITAASLPGTELICFEEPENFIHPHLLEMLVDLLKKCDKQVILATHSPLLVDLAEPEDVIIVEKNEEGATVAKRIEDPDELRRKLNELGVGLGDYWSSGALGGVP